MSVKLVSKKGKVYLESNYNNLVIYYDEGTKGNHLADILMFLPFHLMCLTLFCLPLNLPPMINLNIQGLESVIGCIINSNTIYWI